MLDLQMFVPYYFWTSFQAYHKANDERKRCMLEINVTKSSQEDMKMRQRSNQMANVPSRAEEQVDQLYSPKPQRDVDG